VSYYGKLFNLLYFNEGYHQEHHIAPSCHWTNRAIHAASVREQLVEAGSKPARVVSLFGFLEGFYDK
jgi:fatty acid desaturase